MAVRERIQLMNPDRIRRTADRMAYEIAESNREEKNITLLGIDERGLSVASLVGQSLRQIYSSEKIIVHSIRIRSKSEKSTEKLDIDPNTYLLIVDDVIFSGRTMFEALMEISAHISPDEIHTLVLVDRGHRKYPVRADFVGLNSPTKLKEHVSVQADETGPQQVVLIREE
jgi:pyrimidine operon attenuation protein / uracil phosphoribosyltransferase